MARSVGTRARPDRPIRAEAGDGGAGLRLPFPLYGALLYAGIRVLSVAVAAFLLPHGRFYKPHNSFAHLLVSWDTGWYVKIAAHGYESAALGHGIIFAWFPGYPAAIDAISWVPGISITRAAVCVTIAAGLAAAWGLTRLGMTLTSDRRISLLVTALWATAPSSFVLSMGYSEALFCALAVWTLIALAERHWLTAAGLTILAGTVRSTAAALIAAVAVTALIAVVQAIQARAPITAWWRPAAALLLAPLGLLGYFAYTAWRLGRISGWFSVEKADHMSFDLGRTTIITVKDALIYGPSVFIALTLLVIAAAVALTLWSLTERMPVGLHVYTLGIVLIALASSAHFLGSKPRFLLPAMLLGLPLARALAPARTWVLIVLIVVFAAASTWFSLFCMSVGWAP